MTLLEEINIRIEVYGGREVVAREIENEWDPLAKRHYCYNTWRDSRASKMQKLKRARIAAVHTDQWSKGEIEILRNNSIDRVMFLTGRSYQAIKSKLRRLKATN